MGAISLQKMTEIRAKTSQSLHFAQKTSIELIKSSS